MSRVEKSRVGSDWDVDEQGPSSPGCGLRAWGGSSESRIRSVDAFGVVAGRYRLVRLLAKGGMGSVWEAVDLTAARNSNVDEVGAELSDRRPSWPAGERLALKLMRGGWEATPSNRQRFLREAALASALTGPEFPRVYTYGVDGGAPYIVLELLEGETVARRLARVTSLTVKECRWLAEDVCSGLSIAHSFGVVHRDIHPNNLFWLSAPPGTRSQLKILDFGIAKPLAQDSKLTEFGTIMGCAEYMSPEQIRSGRAVCGQSDFWSVATILYRSLLGRLPFVGSAGAVLASIARDAPPRPSTIAPVGRAVDDFFEVALAKDAAKRFPNARALIDAFTKATADLDPDSTPGVAWRLRLVHSSRSMHLVSAAANDFEAVTTAVPASMLAPRRSESAPPSLPENAVTALAVPSRRSPAPPVRAPAPVTEPGEPPTLQVILVLLVLAAFAGALGALLAG